MLILQIALGIVLAVIILAFLPQILALGAVVIALGLGLLLLGAAIFFFADNPEILIALTGIVVVAGVGYGASESIHFKRSHLDKDDIIGALVVAALWLWMVFLAVKAQDYFGIAIVAACGIVGWFSLVRWDRRAYAKSIEMNQNTDKESSPSAAGPEHMANQNSVAPTDAEEQRRRNLLSAAIVAGIVALPFLAALPYWLFYKFRGF